MEKRNLRMKKASIHRIAGLRKISPQVSGREKYKPNQLTNKKLSGNM
jgi:hypothetical protein